MTMSKSMPATELNQKPVVVIKLGGSMIDQLTPAFYESLKSLTKMYHCLIVHGGGPAITAMLDRLHIKGEFHNGLRKTTEETLEIVQMTMGGQVNARVTSELNRQGIKALGLQGTDAEILTASLIDEKFLGLVGKVKQVEPAFLIKCMLDDYLPVIAPLGKTEEGRTVNINADTAAAALANALQADKLLFVTDVPGIMESGTLLERTTPEEITDLITEGTIYGGMIPKVQSAVEALSETLREVMIVCGSQPLVENNQIAGTKICLTRKEEVQ